VHLTTHWAIPIWFAIPVLQATWLLPRLDDDFDWPRLTRLLVRAWAVLLIGAFVYTAVLSATANPRYSLGRPQMVRAIETRFAERFPGQRLSWAGGTWPESGALAFFAADHPRALPGFPDERRALANPFPSWPGTHGVLLCFASGALAREGSHDVECEQRTREWLRAHQRPIDEQTLRYRAAGWRFIAAQPKNVTVFWVPPRF
jgi:hypothetical protein